MTIDEAIENLERDIKAFRGIKRAKIVQAEQLGIEALKRIKQDRFMAFPYCLNPLPGEIKE